MGGPANCQKYCPERRIAQADEFNLKLVGNRSGHPLLHCQALEYIHSASNDRTGGKTISECPSNITHISAYPFTNREVSVTVRRTIEKSKQREDPISKQTLGKLM